MKPRKSDDIAYLKTRLSYDPETGIFRWIGHRCSVMLGAEAGGPHSNGYIRIRVDGTSYFAHRLAFMFVFNRAPNGEIDHINRDRADNRIINLREATISENRCNSKGKAKQNGNKKGCYLNHAGSWVAEIKKDGIKHHLGSYPSEDLAHRAYCEAAKKLHGEFACTK